jgi:hypothetical protein
MAPIRLDAKGTGFSTLFTTEFSTFFMLILGRYETKQYFLADTCRLIRLASTTRVLLYFNHFQVCEGSYNRERD